jgi:hypothetical protein
MPNESDDSKPFPIRSPILAALVDETMQADRTVPADRPRVVATSRLHDPESTTQPQVVRVDPNAITEDRPVTRRTAK